MTKIFGYILSLSFFLFIFVQASWVYAQTADCPISFSESVISGSTICTQNSNISSPISSVINTNTYTENNPITFPVNINNLLTFPISTPISSPISAPISFPVLHFPHISFIDPNPVIQGERVTIYGSYFVSGINVYVDGGLMPQSSYQIDSANQMSFILTSEVNFSNKNNLPVILAFPDGRQSNTVYINLTYDVPVIQPGQVILPTEGSDVTLNNGASLNLSSGVSTASEGSIDVNGSVHSIGNYTGGNLNHVDLNNVSLGTQNIGVTKGVNLFANNLGETITLVNGSDFNVATTLSLMDETTIFSDSLWDGNLLPPTTVSASGSAPAGFNLGNKIFAVGSALTDLIFDKPITLTISNFTGPVAYKLVGSTNWIQITNSCLGSYSNPQAPVFPGECLISDGTDTKILTYHLTNFATLVSNPVVVQPANSTTSQALSPASTPICTDTKPSSAPVITSIKSVGNSVTITWNQAKDPVTYYLVSYGVKSGVMLYGNPNVGGKGTSSYTINGLSGNQTYYFKVRAGNNCAPGDFSSEVSAFVNGKTLSSIPSGFTPGVLGVKSIQPEASVSSAPSPVMNNVSPSALTVQNIGLTTKILNFLRSVFSKIF